MLKEFFLLEIKWQTSCLGPLGIVHARMIAQLGCVMIFILLTIHALIRVLLIFIKIRNIKVRWNLQQIKHWSQFNNFDTAIQNQWISLPRIKWALAIFAFHWPLAFVHLEHAGCNEDFQRLAFWLCQGTICYLSSPAQPIGREG